jgi:hypothetical protein
MRKRPQAAPPNSCPIQIVGPLREIGAGLFTLAAFRVSLWFRAHIEIQKSRREARATKTAFAELNSQDADAARQPCAKIRG